MTTVILDNGSACIKLLQVSKSRPDRFATALNCVARSKDDRKLFIGPELWPRLQQQPQTMQFRRAHDRGYLTSWETERLIWDELFRTTGVDDALAASAKAAEADEQEASAMPDVLLVLSEPPDNLSTLQEMTDHIVFEYYRFDAFVRCPTALLASYGAATALGDLQGRQREFCLVVDVGFSHTHITPIIDGQVATTHAKRLGIGGKFLTNVLKETISFRHYNMMEETLLVEHIKEACCFVSMEFNEDMERARNGALKTQYLLPDVATNTPGRLVNAEDIAALPEDAQLLPLTSETFTIPELLFTPSDMSHTQGGVVDGIVQAIETLPRHIQGLLLGNLIVLGNSARFKNFEARLERDLQGRIDDALTIRISSPGMDATVIAGPTQVEAQSAWLLEAGKRFACSEQCRGMRVTQDQWRKQGRAATRQTWPGLLAGGVQPGDLTDAALASLDAPLQSTTLPEHNGPGRRRNMYMESERSDTPRSYSPTTEEEVDSDGQVKPKRIKLSDLNRRGRRRSGRGGGQARRGSEKQGSSSRAVSVKSEAIDSDAQTPAVKVKGKNKTR